MVCIFDETTPCSMILDLQPDIVVKGGDYAGTHIPEMDAVATYGGKVEYVSVIEGKSSTSIINRLVDNKAGNESGI